MDKQHTTSNIVSNTQSPELTIEDLKKISIKHVFGDKKQKQKSLFEKVMNKLGWYRQQEWFFVDMRKISGFPGPTKIPVRHED